MTPDRSERLRLNFEAVRASLSGHRARLLVVSKTRPAEEVRALYALGQRDFGENRVQELEEKAAELADLPGLRWHLIGHLQSNKIPKLARVPNLVAVHSVDSPELARRLLPALAPTVGLFLQVNTSGEGEKSGLEGWEEVRAAAGEIPSGRLQGLMTMGTLRTDHPEEEAQRCFRQLREWRDKLVKELGLSTLELSMGMSGDYLIALQEGSDWVRVGSRLFS